MWQLAMCFQNGRSDQKFTIASGGDLISSSLSTDYDMLLRRSHMYDSGTVAEDPYWRVSALIWLYFVSNHM